MSSSGAAAAAGCAARRAGRSAASLTRHVLTRLSEGGGTSPRASVELEPGIVTQLAKVEVELIVAGLRTTAPFELLVTPVVLLALALSPLPQRRTKLTAQHCLASELLVSNHMEVILF